LTCVLLLSGVNTSLDGAPALTVKVADAPLSPAAVALMVATPNVVGMKLTVASPPTGVIGDTGLKPPDTPLAAKLIGLLAPGTLLPLASTIVAVKLTASPACAFALVGVNTMRVGAPGPTCRLALAPTSPGAVAVIVAVPVLVGVKLDCATPLTGVSGEAGLKLPLTPPTDSVIASLAPTMVWPLASCTVTL
jgi:hypothetical protein